MKKNLIDLATVIAISGLSRPTIYRHMDKGIFPRQVQSMDGRVRWHLVEVIRWCITKHPERFGSNVGSWVLRWEWKRRLPYAGLISDSESGMGRVPGRPQPRFEGCDGEPGARRLEECGGAASADFRDALPMKRQRRKLLKTWEVAEESTRIPRGMGG